MSSLKHTFVVMFLLGCDKTVEDTSDTAEIPAACDESAVAVVETVDEGLGIEAVNTTLTGCVDETLQVYQTCCGTRERQVEWSDGSTWIAYEIEDDCDCVGLTDEQLAAGASVTFSTSIAGGPDLCELGGADFRVTYGVGPEGCAEESCFEDIVSNTFLLYCEG